MERTLGTKLTYDDYASAPADGRTYQVLDGDLLVTPARSPAHPRASKRLQRQLEAWFEDAGRGEVFDAPIDVILSPHVRVLWRHTSAPLWQREAAHGAAPEDAARGMTSRALVYLRGDYCLRVGVTLPAG